MVGKVGCCVLQITKFQRRNGRAGVAQVGAQNTRS